jgi:hypothetical protein
MLADCDLQYVFFAPCHQRGFASEGLFRHCSPSLKYEDRSRGDSVREYSRRESDGIGQSRSKSYKNRFRFEAHVPSVVHPSLNLVF